jgi:hypothetical protein
LHQVKTDLKVQLSHHLNWRCTHVAGQGGVKGSVRSVQAMSEQFAFAARFDSKSYYQSINHRIIMQQLEAAQVSELERFLVHQYLTLPDKRNSGKGLVASGAISPLLGALYLTPLDQEMAKLEAVLGIGYRRFMDDFVIFASTRHKLRTAIRKMYAVLELLHLSVHPDKRYIGKTIKGFDFLGYRIRPYRRLRPSTTSLYRFLQRARRLHEQGADHKRLWQYVNRWYIWLRGGLVGQVSMHGGVTRLWVYILKQLKLSRYPTKP